MMHDGGEAGRSGPAADSGKRLWRVLLLSGVALYVASWFFPAVALQVDAGWPRAPWGYGVEAHRGANDLLTRDLTGNDDAWLIRAAGATCLTNYAMVLAIAAALVRRP